MGILFPESLTSGNSPSVITILYPCRHPQYILAPHPYPTQKSGQRPAHRKTYWQWDAACQPHGGPCRTGQEAAITTGWRLLHSHGNYWTRDGIGGRLPPQNKPARKLLTFANARLTDGSPWTGKTLAHNGYSKAFPRSAQWLTVMVKPTAYAARVGMVMTGSAIRGTRVTKKIPIHTKIKALRYRQCHSDSPRKIAERATPNTGIKKLKAAIKPTGLCFNRRLHTEKATADSSAK